VKNVEVKYYETKVFPSLRKPENKHYQIENDTKIKNVAPKERKRLLSTILLIPEGMSMLRLIIL
jgi:hypothetical protein